LGEILSRHGGATSYDSVMLLLCFYSRFFTRQQKAEEFGDHKKARNIVGSFFAELQDPEAPLLGIREILAFASDFNIFLSKQKIQKLWLSLVGDWEQKIGLTLFMEILCVMGDLCFEEKIWKTPTTVGRVQRFVRHFGLSDFKVLKSKLFDIYRDKYIYMYSEYENFDQILKRVNVLSKPSSKVEPLRLKNKRDYREGIAFLKTLVFLNPTEIWEKYDQVAALDFGNLKVGAKHEYKIDTYNTCHFLLNVDVAVESVLGVDPVAIRWNGFKRLSSGCMLSLFIAIDTELATDWFGKLKISVKSAAGESETIDIPCFCRVSGDVASSHLPSLGISPFSSRIPSAQLARFDPSRTDNLRSRRPGSAFTSRPLSGKHLASDCRPGSAALKRPLSSVGPRTNAMSRPDSAAPRRPVTATHPKIQ
jgi:hypothetical protein